MNPVPDGPGLPRTWETLSLADCASRSSPESPSPIPRNWAASPPISSPETLGGKSVKSPAAIRSAAFPSVRSGMVMALAARKASTRVPRRAATAAMRRDWKKPKSRSNSCPSST